MSLSTWLRQLAAGSPRKTIRHSRPDGIKSRLQVFLELLENRLAPATLHWIGSSSAPATELPGLVGEYWQNYTDSTNIVVKTDPAWIGQNPLPGAAPDVIALTDSSTSSTHPSTLTFPNINGTSGFQPYADFTATDPGANHTVARWGGQIFIAAAGNVSFQTGSDDGSILYIDGKVVVNNNQYQGTAYASGTVSLTAGYHEFDEEWYNGGGGANIYTNWDPKGGSAFVPITNAVLFHQATGGNWSDPGSWKEGAVPKSGDTVVFDPATSGFVPQALVPLGAGTSTGGGFFSNNDIPGLTLNGIVVNNASTTPFIITGNAVTINNTDTSLTGGITDTTPGTTTTLSFTSITNGGSMTITNGSAISSTPTLQITSPIDLNGKVLTEASSASGTSDTGLTKLSGVISSSVPTTDSIVQNGGGVLALSGTNTFDGAIDIKAGALVDAGNQALGALTGAGTTVESGGALGLSGGDNAVYTKGVTLNSGGAITSVDNTSPTVAFSITLAGDALIQSDALSGPFKVNSSLTFNGPVDSGNHTLTLNINNNNGNTFRFNGPITAATGAKVVKNGNQRASFMDSSPNFGDGTAGSVTFTVNAGRLADGALNALGTGNNTVTINNGGTLTFRNSIDHTEAQTITIAGPGADTGSGPIGAISSDDGASTLEGSWVIKVASGSDETIGTNGGSLTLGQAVTLTSNNLILQGSSGTLTLTGAITGGSSTSIIKNGGNTATITSDNKATFTGATSVNGGVLAVSNGTLGGGTAPITVKAGGTLGLNAADLGATPVVIGGNGLNGVGAIDNMSGTSHVGGTVTLTTSTTFGSDAGTMTVDKDLAGGKSILTFTGAGNMVFNGAISGDAISHSAGLVESQGSGWDTSPYNPPPIGTDTTLPGNPSLGSDIQLYPFMAETSGNDNALIATTLHRWGTNDNWIYTGTINFPNDPKTPGSGTLTFAKSIDDNTLLRIDGVTYINDTNWQNALNTGGITLAAGPHIFDLRVFNGGGGAGAIDNGNVSSAGWTGWTTSIGFIYRVDSGSTDPKANSKNVSDYKIPTDPGDGSLFQVDFPNVLTKSGSGTVTFNGNNTYVEPTLVTGGTLVAGSNNALGATAKLTVQTGGALGLPAAGGISLPASLPVSIAGSGPTGAGAIESLGGSNTINSNINLASAGAIGSDAGTLTLAGTVGIGGGVITFTGAGNINVTSPMSARAAGLLEGQRNTANDPTGPIDPTWGTDIQPGCTMGNNSAVVDIKSPPFPTTQHTWISTETWIYTGTIFWPSDPTTPGSGTLSFAKDTDDSMFLKIDGTTYISNNSWTTPIGTGPITLKSGPHVFEARFGNGVGGAGPDGQNNNGWTGWTSSIGFVYRVDAGAGTSDPLSNSTNVSDYKIPVDPGDGSLFQTNGFSGVIKSGSGTVTLAPVNSYTGPTTINGGKLVIKDEGTLGAGGSSNNTSPVTINGGTLDATSSFSTTLNYAVNGATSGIMVDAGQTVTDTTVLSGSGTLNKSGAGTLVLTSADSYPGGTVVSAGAITAKTVLSLGTGPVTMSGGTLSLQSPPNVQQTIATSGYTQDVIWAYPTEPQPVEGTTTGYDNSGADILYQAGAVFSPGGSGLPGNGQIVSKSNPAVSFQMQPFTGKNDLLLQNSGSGTLTLANPGKFASLNVLDVSANGTATYNMTLNFSDGSSDQIGSGVTAPNRGTSGNSATGFNGQMQRSDGTASFNGGTGAFWEQDFTLSSADQAKTLTSVTFKETNSGPNLSIFALSGVGIFASPTFNNSVTVTADSTIDDPSQSTAIGALTLKGGTLSLTGTSTTLTTGAVSVTGNAGLNVASGETLALGTISDTGTNSLSVNGAGTTNLANVPSGLTLGGTGTIGTAVAVDSGGAVNPGTGAAGTGTLTTTAGIALASGSTDHADIGGTAAGSFDQISSGGTIDVTGAKLEVALANNFQPAKGQTFTIIKNTGSNPITGTFAGLSEGTNFSAAGTGFTISYVGGSGHDVVLTANPPGAVTHLSVTPSVTKANAGDVVTFTVAALDAAGIINGSYAGTVKFTSSDAAATLPANATLPAGGVGTFDVTFQTSGPQTLTATDTATATITGTSPGVSVGVSAATATHFAITGAPSSITPTTPPTPFNVTVTAQDTSNNPIATYAGTVHFSSTDAAAVLPADTKLTGGTGVFPITLKTNGAQTVTVTDTVSPGVNGSTSLIQNGTGGGTGTPAASYFKISMPAGGETTGTPFAVTVTAVDASGATFPGYSGKVHFTSSDAAAVLPADAALTAGVGVFNVTLMTAGNQTITATDNAGTLPTITGTTSAITTRGLVVTGLTPTATGFTVNFSEPFTVADVNLYGGSQASPLQDVTLVGTASGIVNGSFVVNSSGTIATFKASSIFLSTFFQSSVLPDDTWTVTLASGTGTGSNVHGFFDSLNAPLDGGNNAGHDNYTTSFATANGSKEALSIPDFARGPDGANAIKVPNDSAKGIPVTLANVPAASGVTDVVFTLTYNPTLLTPTGGGTGDSSGTGSTFVMGTPVSVDATHSTVAFTWHNAAAQSGTVVLGDILANVPNSAANQYKGKEILGIVGSSITVNGAAFTGVWANGLHVNTYFGDVTGDGKITGLDVATAGAVAGGSSAGLSSFKLVDPAVIGDIAGDASIDATAVSDLASFTSSLPTPQIPAIPTGLTITPGGPDPTLSLAGVESNGIVSVPVLLDHPHPDGSTGMEEAVLALTYDPKVLTVSSSDITLGSIPGLGAGWHLVSVVDQATGQIGIDLYSTTAITATQAGSLVNIAFHIVPGAFVPATAVQLVNSVAPNGHYFSTEVADDQGQYVLSPGMDRLVVETNAVPVSSAAPVSMGNVVTASMFHGQADSVALSVPEESAGTTSLLLGTEANDILAVISNGSVAGETVALHSVPANMVVTGALAFQTSTASQLAGQVIQITNLPLAVLGGNTPQQLMDRLFLAVARWTDAPADQAQDAFWDNATRGQDWLAIRTTSVSPTRTEASVATDDQQAADQQTVSDRVAVVDEVFAQLADDTDDFGDFGSN